jgi:gas vesicle protein
MKQFAWFVTGVAMGAAAAVLYAPQKGSETRKMIREKGEESYKLAAEKGKQATEQSRVVFKRGVEMAESAKEVVARKVKAVAA